MKTSRPWQASRTTFRAVVVVGVLSAGGTWLGSLAGAVATGATATPTTVQTSTMFSANGSGAYEGDAGAVTISMPATAAFANKALAVEECNPNPTSATDCDTLIEQTTTISGAPLRAGATGALAGGTAQVYLWILPTGKVSTAPDVANQAVNPQGEDLNSNVTCDASDACALWIGPTSGAWSNGYVINGLTPLPASATATTTTLAPCSSNCTTATDASDMSVMYSGSAQNVTLSAMVTSGYGTVSSGAVSFTAVNGSGQTILTGMTGNVINGSASVNYSLPASTAAGDYKVQVSYQPGGIFAASSGTSLLSVLPATTNTSVAPASAASSGSAQGVTLSATVTSAAGAVNGGSVTFAVVNNADVNIGVPASSAAVTGGTASVSYTLPPGTVAGTYTINATYNPSSNFSLSYDNSQKLAVSAGNASTTTSSTSPTSTTTSPTTTTSTTTPSTTTTSTTTTSTTTSTTTPSTTSTTSTTTTTTLPTTTLPPTTSTTVASITGAATTLPSGTGVLSTTTTGAAPTTITTRPPGHATTGRVAKTSTVTTTTVPHSAATTGTTTKTTGKSQHKVSSSVVKTKGSSRSASKVNKLPAHHAAKGRHLPPDHRNPKGTSHPNEQPARPTAATVPTATGGGVLAYTGSGPALGWLLIIGTGLAVAGGAGRRLARTKMQLRKLPGPTQGN
jgi:hypothetical protein